MKRILAAITAALLILSACSANKTQEELPVPVAETMTSSDVQASASDTPQIDAETPAETETSSSNEMETKPIEPEVYVPQTFSDEPYEVQLDQEEIVSMTLLLPYFRLGSENVEYKINSVFMELQLNLQDYMGSTVYETAQARHTIAFLEGNYIAGLEDGILTVTYTVTERYADDDGEITHENVYRFDASTGERLDA